MCFIIITKASTLYLNNASNLLELYGKCEFRNGGHMKRNGFLKISLSAFLVSGMLVGCSKTETEDKTKEETVVVEDESLTATINVWAPEEDLVEGGWLETQLDEFTKAHPKWELTFETTPVNESDVETKALGDPENVADVYFYSNESIPTLTSANVLAELGGDTLNTIQKNMDTNTVKTVTYNGAVYGVPYTTNTWFVYYDKSVFEKDDVKNLDAMLKKGKVGIPLTDAEYISAFYLANGCTVGNSFDFSADKATAVTNYLVDLKNNKNFVNCDTSVDSLKSGKVSAIFSTASNYEDVVEALGEDNVGIAIAPTFTLDKNELQLKPFVSSSAIGVNPNSKSIKVAVALASFLAGSDAQKAHYELENIIPTDINIDDEEDRLLKIQRNTVKNLSVVEPITDKLPNFLTQVGNFGSEVVNGTITKENAGEKVGTLNTAINTEVTE